jgi:tetratricopeptide (TPR) repeat protein
MQADQAVWLKRLQTEHGNLRAALEWCLEAPGSDTGLELAAALSWFWLKRAFLVEGRQWLERALASHPDAPPRIRAKALSGLGLITFFLGDYVAAALALERSAALGRETGDFLTTAVSLGGLGLMAMEAGRFEESARLGEEGRAVAVAGGVERLQGPWSTCLAYAAMRDGDLARAISLTEQSLSLVREMGEKWGMCMHLLDIGLFNLLDGNVARTEAVCREAIAIADELGDRLVLGYGLGILAGAQTRDRQVRAVRLWGAMYGVLDSIASPLQDSIKALVGDRYIDPIKGSMGAEAFQHAVAEGRRMSPPQAVQYALNKR